MKNLRVGDQVTLISEAAQQIRNLVNTETWAAWSSVALAIYREMNTFLVNVRPDSELYITENVEYPAWVSHIVARHPDMVGLMEERWYIIRDVNRCWPYKAIVPARLLRVVNPCPDWLLPGSFVRVIRAENTNWFAYRRVFSVKAAYGARANLNFGFYGMEFPVDALEPASAVEQTTPSFDFREGQRVLIRHPQIIKTSDRDIVFPDEAEPDVRGVISYVNTTQKTLTLLGSHNTYQMKSAQVEDEMDEDEMLESGTCVVCNQPMNDGLDDMPHRRQRYLLYRMSSWRESAPIGCVCEDCLDTHDSMRRCDDCGRLFLDGYVHTDSRTDICDECFEDHNYTSCSECGCILSEDNQYYDEESDNAYCEYCYGELIQSRRTELVLDYSTKPDPYFHWLDADGCEDNAWNFDTALLKQKGFFGVELEISGDEQTECAEDLHELDEDSELFYMKRDCSIGEEGIEIVTHPCTLDYHLRAFPWDRIVEVARAHGYTSHDNGKCGMHVHVSREFFGETPVEQEMNIAKTIILFDRFWNNLVKFSRRTESQLNRWCHQPLADMEKDTNDDVARKFSEYASTRDRYRAINLCNRTTVEFRLFRGTLNLNTIKATLQFLRHVIVFAKQHELIEVQNASWTELLADIEYPELLQYLRERSLLPKAATSIDAVDYDDEHSDMIAA